MPILYPSRSPIDPIQLRQILPGRLSRISQVITGLIPIMVTIILFEGALFVGFNPIEFNVIISIVILMAAVIFTSSRHGAFPGLISGVTASAYLAYVFSPDLAHPFIYPENAEVPLRSIALISSLYLALAAVTGYLREQIQQSFTQEQIARALAEEQQYRLESIMEQLPIGVIITDAKTGMTIFTNNVGRKLISNDTHRQNEKLEQQIKQIASSIEANIPISKEIICQKSDGNPMHLQINVSPILDLRGEHVSNVSTFYDVTQQKEIEQRKDDFISIASHELKTPVTSLKIYMQLLHRHKQVMANSDLSETIAKANSQINKLTRLMSDLLDVSRIQTGLADYKFRPASLNNLVRESVKAIRPSTHHTITVKGKISGTVQADAEKITQVINNILSNAIKYSAKAEKINVYLSQNDQYATIAIQDFGIGIPSSQKHKIFDRFYQIRQQGERSYPGLGIGLFICQRIISDHHGTMSVESTPGSGSIFTVSLPYAQPKGLDKQST